MAAEALTVGDLRDVDLFAELTDDQLRWLTTIGRRETLGDGEVLFARGEPARAFFVLLRGELVFTVTAEDGTERFLTRHVRDRAAAVPGAQHDGKPAAAHQFTGEMPLLLGIDYVATATAIGRTTVARYDHAEFAELIAHFPQVSRILLPVLAWRIHASEAQAGHRATLDALGTLAAGLAHELNNPAAALVRSAADLGASLHRAMGAAEAWGAAAEPAERALLDAVVRDLPAGEATGVPGADLTDAMADRLADAGLDDPEGLADDLADLGLRPPELARLAAGVRPELLGGAVELLAARLRAGSSAGEISAAARRITALVETTRAYTNLDLAPEREFDLVEGIEATLTILAERLSRVRVRRELAPGIPPISGHPRELNQVWTNLVRNAVEAMPDGGTLTVRCRREGDTVVVEIADDGVGIPEALRARMFQPFFTTKDVGRGTGLGLHLVHEIVERRHGGSIAVASRAGDTRIAVRLPIAGPAPAPAAKATRGARVAEHLTQ